MNILLCLILTLPSLTPSSHWFYFREGVQFSLSNFFSVSVRLISQHFLCHYECLQGHPYVYTHIFQEHSFCFVQSWSRKTNTAFQHHIQSQFFIFLSFFTYLFSSEILFSNGRDKNCTRVLQSFFSSLHDTECTKHISKSFLAYPRFTHKLSVVNICQ